MTIKTPEQIARSVIDNRQAVNIGTRKWLNPADLANIQIMLVDAIEADRAQRADPLARVRAVLDAEVGWETPAVLKDRIEWALVNDDGEPTSDPEAEDYGKYLDQQFWGDH